MKEFMVKLTSLPDLKKFVEKANEQNFDIEISGGFYTVDAKSIIAVFSLELSELLRVKVKCNDYACRDFLEEVDEFIVK